MYFKYLELIVIMMQFRTVVHKLFAARDPLNCKINSTAPLSVHSFYFIKIKTLKKMS